MSDDIGGAVLVILVIAFLYMLTKSWFWYLLTPVVCLAGLAGFIGFAVQMNILGALGSAIGASIIAFIVYSIGEKIKFG